MKEEDQMEYEAMFIIANSKSKEDAIEKLVEWVGDCDLTELEFIEHCMKNYTQIKKSVKHLKTDLNKELM